MNSWRALLRDPGVKSFVLYGNITMLNLKPPGDLKPDLIRMSSYKSSQRGFVLLLTERLRQIWCHNQNWAKIFLYLGKWLCFCWLGSCWQLSVKWPLLGYPWDVSQRVHCLICVLYSYIWSYASSCRNWVISENTLYLCHFVLNSYDLKSF